MPLSAPCCQHASQTISRRPAARSRCLGSLSVVLGVNTILLLQAVEVLNAALAISGKRAPRRTAETVDKLMKGLRKRLRILKGMAEKTS